MKFFHPETYLLKYDMYIYIDRMRPDTKLEIHPAAHVKKKKLENGWWSYVWLRSCSYQRQFLQGPVGQTPGLPIPKMLCIQLFHSLLLSNNLGFNIEELLGKPTWQNTPKKAQTSPSHSASSAPVAFLSGAAWVDELRIRDLSKNLMSLILPIQLIPLIHYWSTLYCTILHSSLTLWPLEIKDWSCAVGTSTMWFCFVQAWSATSTIRCLTGLCRL